jgi:prepilin-type N-terminal cleavage/methylation domain-containing protein
VTRGVTLIELLVVVAIIAVLISILVPSLKEAREQSRRIVCAGNLRQIVMAHKTYSTDNAEAIADLVLAREAEISTDLGNGWEDVGTYPDPPMLHEQAIRMGVNLFTYAVTSRVTP